ncbi:hypothetical protein HPP92_012756 [Vanilla planifolia]|uniref:Uncharacterized protein n=1 Tax=Vanilla planifolia TaxID=51239 RepID=A0A835R0L7_VANPL|nr:hypothetical protein HPP92_012756 [Vanilla planifolia]
MGGNKSARKHIKKTKEVMLGSLANGINADNRRNEEEIVEEQSIIPAVAAQGSKNAQSPKATQHVGGILSESSESNESSLHLNSSEDEDVNSGGVPMNAIAELQVSAMEIENAVEGIDERCFGKLISSSKVCNVSSNVENISICNTVLMSGECTQNACRNTEAKGCEYNQNSEQQIGNQGKVWTAHFQSAQMLLLLGEMDEILWNRIACLMNEQRTFHIDTKVLQFLEWTKGMFWSLIWGRKLLHFNNRDCKTFGCIGAAKNHALQATRVYSGLQYQVMHCLLLSHSVSFIGLAEVDACHVCNVITLRLEYRCISMVVDMANSDQQRWLKLKYSPYDLDYTIIWKQIWLQVIPCLRLKIYCSVWGTLQLHFDDIH